MAVNGANPVSSQLFAHGSLRATSSRSSMSPWEKKKKQTNKHPEHLPIDKVAPILDGINSLLPQHPESPVTREGRQRVAHPCCCLHCSFSTHPLWKTLFPHVGCPVLSNVSWWGKPEQRVLNAPPMTCTSTGGGRRGLLTQTDGSSARLIPLQTLLFVQWFRLKGPIL